MTEHTRYSMFIQWSDEDKAYLVTLPEWEGRVLQPCTHGYSYEEAARNGREVVEMLAEGDIEEGKTSPAPRPYQAPVAV